MEEDAKVMRRGIPQTQTVTECRVEREAAAGHVSRHGTKECMVESEQFRALGRKAGGVPGGEEGPWNAGRRE